MRRMRIATRSPRRIASSARGERREVVGVDVVLAQQAASPAVAGRVGVRRRCRRAAPRASATASSSWRSTLSRRCWALDSWRSVARRSLTSTRTPATVPPRDGANRSQISRVSPSGRTMRYSTSLGSPRAARWQASANAAASSGCTAAAHASALYGRAQHAARRPGRPRARATSRPGAGGPEYGTVPVAAAMRASDVAASRWASRTARIAVRSARPQTSSSQTPPSPLTWTSSADDGGRDDQEPEAQRAHAAFYVPLRVPEVGQASSTRAIAATARSASSMLEAERRAEAQGGRRDGVDEHVLRVEQPAGDAGRVAGAELDRDQQAEAAHGRDARDGWRAARAGACRRARRCRSGPRPRSCRAPPAPRRRPAAWRRTWSRGRRARTRPRAARVTRAPIGMPEREALGERHGVRRDAQPAAREPGAAAADARLHLVADQQGVVEVAQLPRQRQEAGVQRVHAALALHGLEQHGRRVGPTAARSASRSLGGTCEKPAGSGSNGAFFCCAQVAWSVASVRPWNDALEADDRGACRAAARPAAAARELDRGLVRLRARVAEERAAVQLADLEQPLGQRHAGLASRTGWRRGRACPPAARRPRSAPGARGRARPRRARRRGRGTRCRPRLHSVVPLPRTNASGRTG